MSEETATTKPRLNLQDCRSQEFVSRLLAATPPYLYSSPTGPHSFFFSEMLRSLVQARANSDSAALRNQQQQQQQQHQAQQSAATGLRRPRKRSWSHHRAQPFEPRKPLNDEKEKPLELTNKNSSAFSSPTKMCHDIERESKILSPSPENINKCPRIESEIKESSPPQTVSPSSSPPSILQNQQSSLRSDLSLPPPPPMWYPPLYPPYGIDPLHFFIDLRVSGHIYDRKKENISPTITRPDNNNCTFLDAESLSKCRQNSAFSVPQPKENVAVNLTSSAVSGVANDNNDYSDSKVENSKNTNYVMHNLPRIYTNLRYSSDDDEKSFDYKNKSREELHQQIDDNKNEIRQMIKRDNGHEEDDDETITIEEID